MSAKVQCLRPQEMGSQCSVVLETKRLVLQPYARCHLDGIRDSLTPKVLGALAVQVQPGNTNALNEFVKDLCGNTHSFAVVRKIDSNIVGCAVTRRDTCAAELSLWLSQNYWGNGYGSECLHALECFAAQKLSPHEHLYLYTEVERNNRAGHNLLIKAGWERQTYISAKKIGSKIVEFYNYRK